MKNISEFVQNSIEELCKKIHEPKKAIIAVSGGIDSTTAAVLCSKAIGSRLIAVHVDTGLMRKDESKEVVETLKELGLNIKLVNAQKRFFEALKGIEAPEEKRKKIGELFIEIFEEEAKKEKAEFLVQGTIAPDWIESGGGLRDTIKTHHNVGGLPKKMELKLIEPLRDLYKDEMREIAEFLKLPEIIAHKQPYPGPGLAVRIIGEVTSEKVKVLQEADAIIQEEIELAVKNRKIPEPWQYFAVLLNTKSVGVLGDARAYGYTIVIRAVESADGMTANFLKIPAEVLEKISIRITNTLKDSVNRVVYDITNKPPATIEWE